MTWVCDIPGADAATSAWHFALHVGLASFVVGAGMIFLALAVIVYRSPVSIEPLERRLDMHPAISGHEHVQ